MEDLEILKAILDTEFVDIIDSRTEDINHLQSIDEIKEALGLTIETEETL